jgi:hypothetical protein
MQITSNNYFASFILGSSYPVFSLADNVQRGKTALDSLYKKQAAILITPSLLLHKTTGFKSYAQ